MLVLCFFFTGSGSNPTGKLPQGLPQVKVDTKGKANVAIPINLPIGTKNIQPDLSIAYHSDAGDGFLGRGWQLNGLHSISRNVSGGDYISSLSGKLAESNSQTSVPKNYYAKNDPFTTYVAKTSGCGDSPAICSWEATAKDGKKYYFGTSADSRIEATSSGNDANIRVWALEKVEDLNGNSYKVTYTKENGSYRPDTITYNNRKVIFGYEDKSNPYTVYTLGGKDYQTKRLKTITIKHTTNGLETIIPHGVYTFHYDTTSYKFTKTEFLNKIERSGYQDINITYYNIDKIEKGKPHNENIDLISYSTKAPVVREMRTTCKNGELACLCTYNPACPDFTTAQETCLALIQYADRCNNGDTIHSHAFFPMDNNGDGKRELFRLVGDSNSEDGIQFSYQKIGEGNYDNEDLYGKYTIQYNSFLSMGDVDGDGKDDFVYTSADEGEDYHSLYVAYSSATSQTGYGFHPPTKTPVLTSIPKLRIKKSLESQATIGKQWLVDINQDGRADFVQKMENPEDGTQDREKKSWVLSVRLSNGAGFDSAKYFNLDHNAISKVDGDWEYSDEFTQITDMDKADGKIDYVNIKKDTNTIIVYKLDLQNLTLTEHTSFDIGDKDGTKSKEERENNMWLVDVNGDGKQDLVALSGTKKLLTYLYTGEKFVTSQEDGKGFVSELSSTFYPANNKKDAPVEEKIRNSSHLNTFADVNNDGKMDFVWYNEGKVNVACSDGLYFGGECYFYIEGDPLLAVVDFNGDGRVDLIRGTIEQEKNTEYKKIESDGTETYRVSTFSFEHLYHGKLHSISGGYSQKYEIDYKLAPLPSVSSARNYPNLPYPYPIHVVNNLTLKQKNEVVGNNQYTYSETRYYVSSIPDKTKSLGFSTITKLVTMGTQKSKDVNTFSQNYDTAASLIEQKHYVYDKKGGTETEKISHQKNIQYEKVTYNKADWVRKKSLTEYHYTEDTSNPLVTKKTTITYSGGNITKRETSITQEAQSGITQENFVEILEMTNHNAYGKPRNIVKKSGGQIIEQVEYVINSKNNVEEKKLSISSSEGDVTTSYTYYSHGNIETKTDPRGNVTTYVYDTDVHTFPTEVKNTYKGAVYTIKMDYDTLNGKLLSQTDVSGISTYIDYDSYGRKLKVWYPGNPKNMDNYNEEFVYVDTENEHSAMRVLKDGSSSGLWYKEYRDDWDRVYKTETKAKEGTLSDTVFTEEMEYYGNRELLKKKSIPYIVESDKKWVNFTYDYLDRPTEITYPDGANKTITYNGFITTIQSSQSGELLVKMNAKQQVTSKTEKGITTTYEYFPSGKLEKAITSAGDETSMTYDRLGRERTHTTPDSGTTTFEYYPNGLLKTKKDARGKLITYKYDSLDRLEEIQRPDAESPIVYEYYEAGTAGNIKKIQDDSGTTELFYNDKGKLSAKMVKIDDYSFIFRYGYDDLGRLNKITYPNGVGINQIYSESGHLQKVTMDSADGTNVGNTVVSYGVIADDTTHQVERLSGNNVKTTLTFEVATKRPERLRTKLANGDIVQDWVYKYKNNGFLESIEDYTNGSDIWSGKYTQIFGYDDKDRLNSAEGYFGPNRERQTLSYHYDDKGNMDIKGDITLTYTHANHPHAVSSATSPSIGTINYDYDAAGNMIHRENDDFHYNSLGKLIQINKQSGEVVDYEYNYTGNRIKKSITNGASTATTYNIDGLYEVNVIPGKAVRHTLYVKGVKDDLLAQLTTENVELLTTVAEAPKTFNLDRFVTYLQMEVSKFFYYTNLENPYNLKLYAFYALLIVGLLYVFSLKLVEISNQESLSTRKFSTFSMFISQLTIVAVLFSCMPKALTGSSENEDPPFWLVTSFVNGGGGIDTETPAITDTPGSFSPGYLSGMPTTGMFFIHPDHLGSTSMLTNAKGEMVAGVDINSGKSYVSYKPYGEVNRTNSSGPDIFRYKYTAQESDSETDLHYYKARYYDPMIGHFTQADAFIDSENVMGLNQYLYTGGNPVNYLDSSGNVSLPGFNFGFGETTDFLLTITGPTGWVVGLVGPSVIKGLEKAKDWIDDRMVELSKYKLLDIAVTIVVVVAAFAAAVAIGYLVGTIAGGIAGSGILPAVPWSGFANAIIQYSIEGALGYYAGEFVNTIGREIGRMVGAFFSPNFMDMNSAKAQRGADVGYQTANVVNDVTEVAADLFSPWDPNYPNLFENSSQAPAGGSLADGTDHPSFHMFDSTCGYTPGFYGPSDGYIHFLGKNFIGQLGDRTFFSHYYSNHTMWGKNPGDPRSFFFNLNQKNPSERGDRVRLIPIFKF